MTDDTEGFTGFHSERNVVDDLAVLIVGEVDVFEFDFTGAFGDVYEL